MRRILKRSTSAHQALTLGVRPLSPKGCRGPLGCAGGMFDFGAFRSPSEKYHLALHLPFPMDLVPFSDLGKGELYEEGSANEGRAPHRVWDVPAAVAAAKPNYPERDQIMLEETNAE
eukprot:4697436-Amphidinium_carterae.1